MGRVLDAQSERNRVRGERRRTHCQRCFFLAAFAPIRMQLQLNTQAKWYGYHLCQRQGCAKLVEPNSAFLLRTKPPSKATYLGCKTGTQVSDLGIGYLVSPSLLVVFTDLAIHRRYRVYGVVWCSTIIKGGLGFANQPQSLIHIALHAIMHKPVSETMARRTIASGFNSHASSNRKEARVMLPQRTT